MLWQLAALAAMGMGIVNPELLGLPELDGLSLPSGRVLQQEDRECPGSGAMRSELALGTEESCMEGTLRQGTVRQACPSLREFRFDGTLGKGFKQVECHDWKSFFVHLFCSQGSRKVSHS